MDRLDLNLYDLAESAEQIRVTRQSERRRATLLIADYPQFVNATLPLPRNGIVVAIGPCPALGGKLPVLLENQGEELTTPHPSHLDVSQHVQLMR